MQVMTVQGPIEPQEMGITLPHDHLLCDLTRPRWRPTDRKAMGSDFFWEDEEVVLEDEGVAIDELLYFKRAGGDTLVEVTPYGLGRNPEGLRRISQATGVHIIMGCGFYFEMHHPSRVTTSSTNALAAEIERDLTVGAGETGIRAGVIGEIATNRDYISPAEERCFRAAARAHCRTGAAITTHAVHGRIGLAQLDLLEEEGVDLRRVVVGHCDLYRHLDYFEAIAKRGACTQFDLINSWSKRWQPELADWCLQLIQLGHGHQLLLSQDSCVRPFLRTYGGGGYDYILTRFVPQLSRVGLNDSDIAMLLVENPKRMFSY